MICPKCGVEVIFGLVKLTKKLKKLWKEGKVAFGGCIIRDKNYCPKCKALLSEFRYKDKKLTKEDLVSLSKKISFNTWGTRIEEKGSVLCVPAERWKITETKEIQICVRCLRKIMPGEKCRAYEHKYFDKSFKEKNVLVIYHNKTYLYLCNRCEREAIKIWG